MTNDQEKQRRGGVAAAVVGMAFFLMPLLYVLSVGPAAQFYAGQQPPPWVMNFYAPIEYLANALPMFEATIEWYIDFWV